MAESAALDPRPGLVLGDGRYRLDQLIGSGGMATVWRATDRRLSRVVAVKLISEALADDPTYAERFAREARTAAGLSHPNLVQVYDYGADERHPFLVMEYVDGGTLAERLERGPVRGVEAVAVAGDLLAALACIHSAGILHRDVKPANVLLSSDGRARITDFGIAHPEDSTRLTQTGHLVGTLRYLAPEVIDGQPASRQSDLYALGVVLRDLAGGEPDATTDALVARLTDGAPDRRPASAEAARELLGRTAAAPEPTERLVAPPVAPPVAPAPVVRRRPRPPATPRPRPAAAADLGRAPRTGAAARFGSRGRGRHGRIAALAAGCALLAGVLVAVAVGVGGGGSAPRSATTGSSGRPAAAATAAKPGLTNRLDELDRLVRAAGQP